MPVQRASDDGATTIGTQEDAVWSAKSAPRGSTLISNCRLALDPTAPTRSRLIARQALCDAKVAGSDIDAVELIVSEIVTNAVRHGSPAARHDALAEPTLLTLRLVDSDVVVEVSDTCPRMPCLALASPWDEQGRGLQLVAALSSCWGAVPVVVHGEQVGKIVWARVPVRFTTEAGADA